MADPIRPKFEPVRELISVLLISKFDDDIVKNKWASLETQFSHYKSMGHLLDAQGHLTPSGVVRSGQTSNSFDILCLSSFPASFKKYLIKKNNNKTTTTTKKKNMEKVETSVSPLQFNGRFLLPGKYQRFDPVCQHVLSIYWLYRRSSNCR